MSTYAYDNDYEREQALGRFIGLKRGSDIIADAIIYHGDCWWRVLGNGTTMDTEILYVERAGSAEGSSEEVKIPVDESRLYPSVSEGAPLQFRDGTLLTEPWPCCEIIYVKDARRRSVRTDPDEKVFGIFTRRYDSEGDPYYYPADQELQPGVASTWILDPKYDLILDWEPVDVADLLERMQKEHG